MRIRRRRKLASDRETNILKGSIRRLEASFCGARLAVITRNYTHETYAVLLKLLILLPLLLTLQLLPLL